MPILMQLEARYVTQSSLFSNQLGKALSDKRITYYQKRGFYGPTSPFVRAKVAEKVEKKKRVARNMFNGL